MVFIHEPVNNIAQIKQHSFAHIICIMIAIWDAVYLKKNFLRNKILIQIL